jgi:general secretion pathway protein E
MGVESFLLASTLRLIVAQRLVRRLCESCKTPAPADPAVAGLLGIEEGWPIYRATGCPACNGTGYAGRIGVYEAIRVDDRLRRLIGADAEEDALARAAFAGGGLTLAQSTRTYVLDGLTTAEEAVRVSRQETASDPEGAHDGV